ncbi:MAG: hypothetical protein Q8891_16400 [Bacteroidota bacterium]|nr:hypothetical protein [Bacteroidota bacterium]
MSDKAKIHLSALEMELVNNKEWIFTKQQIIEKVYHILGELHQRFKKIVEDELEFLPAIFPDSGGKISKGENYMGLPYLILDYPARFSKDNVFAVRTMFWWGNYFSISLHLSGADLKNTIDVSHWLDSFKEENFLVCVNEKEWEHNFESSNFLDIKKINDLQVKEILQKDFFKFGKKIELGKWDYAQEFLEQSFKEIIKVIKLSCPDGEIVP